MTRISRVWRACSICIAALSLVGGCSEGDGADQGTSPPPVALGGVPGPIATAEPGIKQIMTKLAKGPNALTSVIGKELNQDPPPWETIQGHAKEYYESASEMSKYDPPKGTNESWIKLTTAYADMAAGLERAAVAKNKESAKLAHTQLQTSCNACHQQHRGMGRPPGGLGVGPHGGRPGGPPPGGPGGEAAPGVSPRGGPGGPPSAGPGGPSPGGPR
jgi:hypothetical protein